MTYRRQKRTNMRKNINSSKRKSFKRKSFKRKKSFKGGGICSALPDEEIITLLNSTTPTPSTTHHYVTAMKHFKRTDRGPSRTFYTIQLGSNFTELINGMIAAMHTMVIGYTTEPLFDPETQDNPADPDSYVKGMNTYKDHVLHYTCFRLNLKSTATHGQLPVNTEYITDTTVKMTYTDLAKLKNKMGYLPNIETLPTLQQFSSGFPGRAMNTPEDCKKRIKDINALFVMLVDYMESNKAHKALLVEKDTYSITGAPQKHVSYSPIYNVLNMLELGRPITILNRPASS